MKAKSVKKRVCTVIEKMVKNTIGRSIPSNFHEPKVPECLKKNK